MTKKSGRNKLEITQDIKDEVEEIIQLKIQDLDGFNNKLTFYNVYQFNKKIANNPNYLNSKGKVFNQYSSDFWSVKYKNTDNYGRARILYHKEKKFDTNNVFNGEFNPDIKDIILAVQELHKKPERLIKCLERIYTEDKNTIQTLQSTNDELRDLVEKQNTLIKNMEQAMYNIFFASTDSRNSLKDVLSLKKSKDWFVKDELEGLVGSRSDFLKLLSPQSEFTNLVPLKRKKLSAEEQGF